LTESKVEEAVEEKVKEAEEQKSRGAEEQRSRRSGRPLRYRYRDAFWFGFSAPVDVMA